MTNPTNGTPTPQRPLNQQAIDAAKTTKSITPEQATIAALQARLQKAEAALAAANSPKSLRFGIGPKGGIMVLGLQGFPVTLYAFQLMRLYQAMNSAKEFMVRNWDKLNFQHKDGSDAPEQAAEVEAWLQINEQ